MEQIRQVMQQMISISEVELNEFPGQIVTKTFKKNKLVSFPDKVPNEIFFINKRLIILRS